MRRQVQVLNDLNDEYFAHINSGKSVDEAYTLMIQNKPFRILANATHDWEEKPIPQVEEEV